MNNKPLNQKSYGSIGHLPNSRMGEGDHHCPEGQAKIATIKTRDKYDTVIVQEKLDGGNVGIVKINSEIIPITRTGYTAISSNYELHHLFHNWVMKHKNRFYELLQDQERVCGEWLAVAHGTKYDLPHEPFVAFDIMTKMIRTCYDEFTERVLKYDFIIPRLIHKGEAYSVENMLEAIKISGHGAIDPVEGAIWRIERNELIKKNNSERKLKVDFLTKYVKPDKIDGIYLNQESITYNAYKEN